MHANECNKMFIIHTRVASCLFPREVPSNSPFECKVTEAVPDTPPTFCFSAKEGQLVQVMVRSYTCPTFVLSVTVVLLVVLLLKSRKSAACPETGGCLFTQSHVDHVIT